MNTTPNVDAVGRNLGWRVLLALGVLCAVSFVGVTREPWTPDEPREAEISREMWLAPAVVPSLNGESFIEKPPLYYLTVAGVFAALGGPSATAARSVSAVASFLTLLLVFLWGRREFSTGVGLAAAFGLATSVQFMLTSHWIVIDPLLMLMTTAALSAGHLLVSGRGSRRTLLVFYGALALALGAKGLIGPVLVAAGLIAYAASLRSFAPIKAVHPVVGAAVMVLTTGVLAGLIGAASGAEAVREWLWVNHVQRFIAPTHTGHDQPFYYYLSAVPIAVFPWWLPFGALFRPSTWRRESSYDRQAKIYLGAMSLGMVLLLSASATKRGLYLLPMLPPLFLLLAATAADWWARMPSARIRGWAWWSQVVCVALLAAAPAAAGLAYLKVLDGLAVIFLAVVFVVVGGLAVYSRRGDRARAVVALGTCAVAAVVGLFGVTARLAAPQKDLSPFVAWVGEQTPPDQPIYLLGVIDETIEGIVPFVTGRQTVALTAVDVEVLKPAYVLVQGGSGGSKAAMPGLEYELLRERTFGPERYMALWVRRSIP